MILKEKLKKSKDIFMTDFKIIVVGAGSIGARHISNLVSLGYTNLVVVDVDPNLLKKYSGEFKCFQNYNDAIQSERPDVSFICSPTPFHLEQSLLALTAGCDVFIEKPIGDRLERIDELERGAKGKIVMVGCNWRFNRGFVAFSDTISSGRSGEVLYVRIAAGYFLPKARPGKNYKKIYASLKTGGGVLLDSGSHILNYSLALFGDISKIYSLKNTQNYLGIESDEITHLLTQHTSGVTCDISLDYVSRKPINRIEAVCSKGTLQLDLVANTLNWYDGKTEKILYNEKSLDPNLMYMDELKHFFECIDGRAKPLQTISDAKKVLELILKANREGQL